MMSGMSLETCWAFNKFWNNKFYYKVASCWLFLLIHTTMHGSMNSITRLHLVGYFYWVILRCTDPWILLQGCILLVISTESYYVARIHEFCYKVASCWLFLLSHTTMHGSMNSITRLHLVGYFYWVILRCTDPWILLQGCILLVISTDSYYDARIHEY